jgi:large conductance mechanosensitive channel
MFKEFKTFLTKTNALALAVGFIIGAATGKVVSAIVDDLIMPLIGTVLPSGDWREAKFVLKSIVLPTGKTSEASIQYGHFIGTLIDFLLIALSVFVITKLLLRAAPAPVPPATKACPDCLETIPKQAKKCRACGSSV